MSEPTLSTLMMDLRLQADRVKGIVEEVEHHIAAGNLDTAAFSIAPADVARRRRCPDATPAVRRATRA